MNENNIIKLVLDHFDGDIDKTMIWFSTRNPLLGNVTPNEMLEFGRADKLRKFIKNCLAGNIL